MEFFGACERIPSQQIHSKEAGGRLGSSANAHSPQANGTGGSGLPAIHGAGVGASDTNGTGNEGTPFESENVATPPQRGPTAQLSKCHLIV